MNFRNSLSVIFFSALVFSIAVFASAQSFSFNRDLKLGDSGTDVLELQKLLNQSADTRIANSGVGAPGQETTYFGNLTHSAVIKFQNKYASEILTPVGLTYGTGYFGPSTRAKANGLLNNEASNENNFSQTQTDTTTQNQKIISVNNNKENEVVEEENYLETQQIYENLLADLNASKNLSEAAQFVKNSLGLNSYELSLAKASEYEVEQGSDLLIYGSGFRAGQSAYLGTEKVFGDLISPNEIKLKIQNDLEDGLYPLYIKEINSNKYSETIDVFIGESASSKPDVKSIEFDEHDLIITGKNFGKVNSVQTSLGLFRNIQPVSSNKIKIDEKLIELSPYIRELKSEIKMTFSVRVLSESGVSDVYTKENVSIKK
jgi:peptidoglycan hydrolase-like protein with peptidoglycan-binding domain